MRSAQAAAPSAAGSLGAGSAPAWRLEVEGCVAYRKNTSHSDLKQEEFFAYEICHLRRASWIVMRGAGPLALFRSWVGPFRVELGGAADEPRRSASALPSLRNGLSPSGQKVPL